MISVVIPIHNQARTLARAVESVWAQGIEDLEVIVVDDGSTDNVADVLREFSGDNKLTYLHQENRGPAAARNAGIAASRGDLIAFLDADDFWLAGKLKAQLAAMKTAGRRFSFTGSEIVDADGKVISVRPAADNDGEFCELVWGNRFPTPSVLVERSLLNQCGTFDESMITGEDWDLWLRLSAAGPGACVAEPMVAVTGVAEWQADRRQLRNLEHSTKTALARIFELVHARKELEVDARQLAKIKSWHYAVLAKSFRRSGNFARAFRYSLRAMAASPGGLSYLKPGSAQPSLHRGTIGSPAKPTDQPILDFEVSVLIRTYNRADMLRDAVESALQQTLPAKEIVIIDDGSTDETPGVIESYQTKHPQIRHVRTANHGAGRAAKRGVEECRSTYTAFLDSDDVWLPNHLQLAAQEFTRNRSAVMVFTGYGLIDAEGKSLVSVVQEPALSNPRREFLLKRIIVQPTRTIISKQAVLDVGGYPAITAGEDWALSVLIAARFPAGVVQSTAKTALLRLHGAQSFTRPLALQESLLEATDYTFDRLPKSDRELKPRVISTHLLHCAIFLWQAGETREAWRSLFRAARVRAAAVATKEFVAAFARLVVPSSIGKAIRRSKRSKQRDRNVGFGSELAQPAVRPRREQNNLRGLN